MPLSRKHGAQLVARHRNWSASAWELDGHEQSVEAQVHTLQHCVDNGGVAALLASRRLVGIGAVAPQLRRGIASLAFLHVSAPLRSAVSAAVCPSNSSRSQPRVR
jgi:hypothetical protein